MNQTDLPYEQVCAVQASRSSHFATGGGGGGESTIKKYFQ